LVGQTLIGSAGLKLAALNPKRVANDRLATGVVDANAVVTMASNVVASAPSVPTVRAAPTETVNLLVSTLVPARAVPAVAVPAIVIASEGEVLDSLDWRPESPYLCWKAYAGLCTRREEGRKDASEQRRCCDNCLQFTRDDSTQAHRTMFA
jgi:hypothetical protein